MKIFLAVFGLMVAFLSNAQAQDIYEKHLTGFDKTKIQVDCISKEEVRSVKVLDSEHILFKMKNDDYVLNTLEKRCMSMMAERRIQVSEKAYCSERSFQTDTSKCDFGGFEIFRKNTL